MKNLGWSFGFYFLYFAAFAFLAPFIILYYQQLNLSGVQIGLLAGLPSLITMVASPLLSNIADRTRRHHLILGLGIVCSAVLIAILPQVQSFVAVLILIIFFNFLFSPVASLGDAAAMAMLGEQRELYGRVRLGGTLGWGIFALVAGRLLDLRGVGSLFYMFSAIMLINLFISRKLYFGQPARHDSESGRLKVLLQSRRWIVFLAIAFLGGLGAFSVAVYFAPYLKDLNGSGNQISIAIAAATLPELLVFFMGDRLIKRFTSNGLFVVAVALMGLRSILFGLVNSVLLGMIIQILGGAIYPAMWLAAVAYADEHAPANLKSTAQGLLGAMSFGFGSAFGGFLGGPLLESIGSRGMFLVFGIIMLTGLALVEGAKRLIPDREALTAKS